jgi:hypothetical protein
MRRAAPRRVLMISKIRDNLDRIKSKGQSSFDYSCWAINAREFQSMRQSVLWNCRDLSREETIIVAFDREITIVLEFLTADLRTDDRFFSNKDGPKTTV